MKIFLILLNVVSGLVMLISLFIGFLGGITNDKTLGGYTNSSVFGSFFFLVVSIVLTVVYLRMDTLQAHRLLVVVASIAIVCVQIYASIAPYSKHDNEIATRKDDQKKQFEIELRADSERYDVFSKEKRALTPSESVDFFIVTHMVEAQSEHLNRVSGLPEPFRTTWQGILHNGLLDVDGPYFISDGYSEKEYTLAQSVVDFHIELFKALTEGYPLTKERIDNEKLLLRLVKSANPQFADDCKEALTYMLDKGADITIQDDQGKTATEIVSFEIKISDKSNSQEYNAANKKYLLYKDLLAILEARSKK